MARPLRIEYPGAFYHVYSRGLERREIFRDRSDFVKFLKILTKVQKALSFICHSYCLMPNHYHLYLETPLANLSKVMQEINGCYTQSYNRRYKRVGPLFQGRYKAKLVDQDAYSLPLSRYIHLNPVKAKLASRPEGWEWSSYGIMTGHRKREPFLETEWLMKQIGGRKELERFTLQGLQDEWDPLGASGHGPILGTEVFVEKVKEKFVPHRQDSTLTGLRELRKSDRVKEVERCVAAIDCDEGLRRKLLLYGWRRYTALSLKEAGELAERMKPVAVSQTVRRLLEEAGKNKKIELLIRSFDCKM